MEKAIDPESLCSMDSSELLIRFQPLIEGEVRRYAAIIGRVASGVEDDLRQCAALGFLSALSSFDPKRSPAFIPYVRNGIGMAIRKEISDNLRMIRQPKGTLEKARVLRRAYAEAAAEGIDIADDAEMMRLTGFSPLVLRNARRSLEREEMMELDSLPGDIAAEASHEDEVIKGMMVEELEKAIGRLCAQDAFIIKAYAGAFGEERLSVGEIASRLSLPLRTVRSRIERIRKTLGMMLAA